MSTLREALGTAVGTMVPVYHTCKKCGRRVLEKTWQENHNICPYCGRYDAMKAQDRFALLFDEGSVTYFAQEVKAKDPLNFEGYQKKLRETQLKSGLTEGAVCAEGLIDGFRAVAVDMDTRFFMGSMSAAVGERITRAIERADEKHLPLIIFCASGGARMQEGIYSLMQMAKTAAAIQTFSEHGGLYISVLTHPTTGGVTASFATLGDITLAEPNALIGFAGPRVIEQTIGQKLPKGFQRAEYLYDHGFVDAIVPRKDQKQTIARLLSLHNYSREAM